MKTILRLAGAGCLLCAVAAWASTALASGASADSNTCAIEWMEPCAIPSATATSSLMYDDQVQPTSACDSCCGASCDACCDACSGGDCGDCVGCGEGCSCGMDACAPTWTVAAGVVYLHRSRPDPAVIMTPPTGTPGQLIGATDFGFGWDAGPDVALWRRLDSGRMIEARYFNDTGADASFQVPQVTTFRVAGIGVTILGGGSINSRYVSTLHTSELNLHSPVRDNVTLLAGFRWIEFSDSLRNNIATPNTFTNWDEQNHMYGGQVGTNIRLTKLTRRMQANVSLKGGIYGTEAENRFTSNIVARAHDNKGTTSFVGDLNFTTSYKITQHMSLYGGYQILWLEHVAIAGEQGRQTMQIAGGTTSPVDATGQVWYNGGTGGVEFLW